MLMERQDTAAFRELHLKDARYYIVGDEKANARTYMRDVNGISFNKKEVIKERMRDSGVVVQVKNRIASVWAPYDLWVNDVFSHCGVDVFTLLKTGDGWKIASCSYTIEKNTCK
jgi:hypothetical protein